MTTSPLHLDRPARPTPRLGSLPAPRVDAVTALTWYLFLLMIIPSPLIVGPLGAAGRPAMLLAAALLAWYLLAKQHPLIELARDPQPVRAAAIVLCCSVLASYISGNLAAISTTQSNAADRGLILLAGWLGVLLFAADGIASEERLATLLRRIVLGAAIMAAIGIAEFATGIDVTKFVLIPGLIVHQQPTDLLTRAGLIRANSTAAQPLEFSAVLTMSLPLALHQARYSTRPRQRLGNWLQVALIAATIPMAVSRSAIVALAIIAVMLIPTWPVAQRRRVYLLLAACPLGLWLIAPAWLTNFAGIFGQLGTDTSTTSRADALSLAAPIIAAHPWFGQGLATFDPQTSFFVDDQFITSLIETGVVGLLAVVALFATGWYLTHRLRIAALDPKTKDLARCLAACLAVGLTCFATFDVLSFSIASGLFFLLVGCAGAAWRLAGSGRAG
jgi:O-antigen ligase/polysaccharide polymerase Wzy-like membrane protein